MKFNTKFSSKFSTDRFLYFFMNWPRKPYTRLSLSVRGKLFLYSSFSTVDGSGLSFINLHKGNMYLLSLRLANSMEVILYAGGCVDIDFSKRILIIEFLFACCWMIFYFVFVFRNHDKIGHIGTLKFFLYFSLNGYILREEVLFCRGEPAFSVVPYILSTVGINLVMKSFLFEFLGLMAAFACAIF